jgi:hypothetical protein
MVVMTIPYVLSCTSQCANKTNMEFLIKPEISRVPNPNRAIYVRGDQSAHVLNKRIARKHNTEGRT